MQLQAAHLALTNLLGSDEEVTVVVVKTNFTRNRMMQSQDGHIVFEQRAEEDGEWLVTDFMEPEGNDNWPFTVKNAAAMGLKTPDVAWSGVLENLPDELLLGDDPLWVRRVDQLGWIDLRKLVKERSKAQA